MLFLSNAVCCDLGASDSFFSTGGYFGEEDRFSLFIGVGVDGWQVSLIQCLAFFWG